MPKHLYTLIITYTNGSKDELPFDNFMALRDTFRHGISYSGGRVQRVESRELGSGLRTLWDASWDEISKAAAFR